MTVPTPDGNTGATSGPATGPAVDEPATVEPGTPVRAGLLRRVLKNPTAVACLVVIGLLVLVAVLAPWLTSQDPARSSVADALAAPGGDHPLGTDGVGRDVLARLLHGTRTSLVGAAIATGVALLVGVPAGLVAGYFRGWFDALSSWVANLLMAVPAIIVLLVVLSVVGQSTYLAMAVFGFLLSPGVYRLIRASVTAVREELYVDAARVSGLSDARIIRRHILPVVAAPSIIQAAQMLGVGIIIQSGLEFLGLGSASQPSWGSMLSDAFQNIYLSALLLLWPGAALALAVIAFALLGNALRDAVENAEKPRRSKATAAAAAATDARDSAADPRPPSVPLGQLAGDEVLVVRDLRVRYPRQDGSNSTVVDGVDLAVRRGEVLGLVGESGSGKSQTAFSVLGLLPPEASVEAATMTFGGQDLTAMSAGQRNELRGRRIGYIPQEPMSNLDPSFTIGYQLVEPVRRHLGLSKAAAKEKALALLARVGIPDPQRVFDAYPHEVSGGMAQRVLIAGAVSCEPDLLIADEPTTALDVTVQAEVLDLIRSLQEERDMAVLLVTHDFGVVADLCDQVAVMQTGRIVEAAPVHVLFAEPSHEYTRMLLDSTLEDAAPRPPLRTRAQAPATAQEVQA
ncbi:dipeptide/oligopeptide/nickel ABC transporter permease/ATP-binding protein [Paenibacillus sp. TRM 82003]|uniref:dipeptide/oligopeptide/nickel ABC transporter permease/ATP-binding protein n=1 Tax=Kineococcus sp. TRM81007 TaxID=2925831 RepID=UPI001F579494|nr:dipeptide/oligopeptide/nickel ABC transporter permease/ATP-binding protein [Kineococcus sp. TRM81007]MCI2237756.1 dipeptide/oligopeptide/nickel ABC transporter permease/ATP-binding protein [Kineococcus sp. TRM81007]MCI3921774.1 dipeptide/oligopeptide/nickel ABC transporter permease/ATP-binding protein [Paenibacillus sp. TRM 82003]